MTAAAPTARDRDAAGQLPRPHRPGRGAVRVRVPVRRQHPGRRPARRGRDRPVLHAAGLGPGGLQAGARRGSRAALDDAGDALRPGLGADLLRRAAARRRVREQDAALPLRPAAGPPAGRAGRRPGRGGLEPRRPAARGRALRRAASSTSRSTPSDKPARGGRAAQRLLAELPVDLVVLARYMQILSPAFVARWPGAHHQHPPLVPAGLRRRQALPPGARSAA